jgi:hypothetical protein
MRHSDGSICETHRHQTYSYNRQLEHSKTMVQFRMRTRAVHLVLVACFLQANGFTSLGDSRLKSASLTSPSTKRQRLSMSLRENDSETQPSSFPGEPQDRRKALSAVAALALGLAAQKSNAFDWNFPAELTGTDEKQGSIVLGTRSTSQQRADAATTTMETRKNNMVNFNMQDDLLPSLVWGGALWLLAGSRSNPLATPIANILYDPEQEQWLKDRNAGLFASPPLPFLLLLGFVFICLGVVTQFTLLQLAEGDSSLSLQLAGVSLIGGGALELGRIATMEKGLTRDEFDRDMQLQQEFEAFASKRLQTGGNCHRTDVVSSFRRFYAKYRQVDSEQYPLTDLEIEQLLRWWNGTANRGRAEMTSGGFYYGIQINQDADVFVSRL